MRPTVTFNTFDVVRVPFPFTDKKASKFRPALVLSDASSFNVPSGHAVMAMITSADNPPWPLDTPVRNLATAGLPSASIVRCKIFTLDVRLVSNVVGTLSDDDRKQVQASLSALMPN